MMDWTDRHCRYLHRLLSGQALLYTEMVTSPALVRGGALHLLDHDVAEHPVALQLGGSDPVELAQAARLGAQAGYDEINLNVGCPSDRVQSGTFGAVLMRSPAVVADCVKAMRDAVDIEITVKCRIGVDDQDPSEVLPEFLARIVGAGCERVTIHARKAWLKGLSPKENRDIPPLDYELVQSMKGLFPNLHISIPATTAWYSPGPPPHSADRAAESPRRNGDPPALPAAPPAAHSRPADQRSAARTKMGARRLRPYVRRWAYGPED